MAKYRGKHEGKTRGKYIHKVFISEQNSEHENYNFAEKIYDFMYEKGFYIDQGLKGSIDAIVKTFHLAGVSVGIKMMNREDKEEDLPQYYTRIKLISNDSLEDVIQKISNEFPSFKEAPFQGEIVW